MITRNSKLIVVADDSSFFRVELSHILTEAGHRVKTACNGEEVIEVVREAATAASGATGKAQDKDAPDLIILDLQMPEIDGFGVLEWLKEHNQIDSYPVLAITGAFEPGDVLSKLKDLGARGLLTKASSPEEVVHRVNDLLFNVDENRKGPQRVPISVPADFIIASRGSEGTEAHTGFLLNISQAGLFLHTRLVLEPEIEIKLTFQLPGSSRIFEVAGVVQWTTHPSAKKKLFGGAGVMFTSIADDDMRAIGDFVNAEQRRLRDR